MTAQSDKDRGLLQVVIVGLLAWVVPGAGYIALGDRRRGLVVGGAIVATFLLGLYIGSIGVVDPAGASLWYAGQMLASPMVSLLGQLNIPVNSIVPYESYGKPYEIGQIYTSIAGALNLLCIINAAYMAYSGKQQPDGD